MSFTVRAFGSNGSGQLALGHTDDVAQPTNCIFVEERRSRPISIASGGNHTLLLCEDGSLYATGENENGRCGIEVAERPLTAFHRVRFRNQRGEIIDSFKFVAATWEASTFVTSNGLVFTAGSGSSGELGQGHGINGSNSPQVIPKFPPSGTEIVGITACMRHTVVVLSDGKVYGWGAGRKGQLGEPKDKAIWSPRILEPSNDKFGQLCKFDAVKAACCRDFTYILGTSGGQYSIFGTDNGEGVISSAPHPASKWVDVAATWKGIYELIMDGSVNGWGSSRVPLDSPLIKTLSAGSEHVLVETLDGRVLASGWGEHGNCGEAIDDKGLTKGWNEICRGILLGAGCATSWVLVGEIGEAASS